MIARIDPSLFQSDLMKTKASYKSSQAAVTRRSPTARTRASTSSARSSCWPTRWRRRPRSTRPTRPTRSPRRAWSRRRRPWRCAKAAIDTADVNLLYTTILSPIDGVVISRDVSVGQTVAASLSAPQLFSIAEDLKAMEVHTNVAESDVGALKQDMKVRFTVDAYPNERFFGTVAQIRNAPLTLQNVVTLRRGGPRRQRPAQAPRPGMTASVTFIVDERRDVLAVPNAALRFTPSDPKIAALAPKPDGERGAQARGQGATRARRAARRRPARARRPKAGGRGEAEWRGARRPRRRATRRRGQRRARRRPRLRMRRAARRRPRAARRRPRSADAKAEEGKGERRRRRGHELGAGQQPHGVGAGRRPAEAAAGADRDHRRLGDGDRRRRADRGHAGDRRWRPAREPVNQGGHGSPFNTMGGGGRGGGGGWRWSPRRVLEREARR